MTTDNLVKGKVLLFDKPLEWTSFQVVNKVRWLLKRKFKLKKIKVGHAGTLDPLATGLLVICIGKETKNIHHYQAAEKEYTGTITLGATTPSYDLETAIDQTFDYSNITEQKIQAVKQQFIGIIDQKPPLFSAVKKSGVRLYEHARKGETVEIESRKVCVFEFEITKIQLPHLDFRVRCSKGTYIRSLAHDFGQALQNGAYLSALRRTKIGDLSVEDAYSPESFEVFIQALEIP